MDLPAGEDCDYHGTFTADVAPDDDRTAEQWARDALEGAPVALRAFIVTGWRLVLRLRLGPRHSPQHVLGWHILLNEPDHLVLEARSSLMTAQLSFRLDGGHVAWTTFVRYERGLTKAVWPPVLLLHRRIVPYTLNRASKRRRGQKTP